MSKKVRKRKVRLVAKIKAKVRGCQLIVKVTLSRTNEINKNELNFFSGRYLRGFLKPEQVKRNSLVYSGPVGVPLSERLKNPISKYDFFFAMEQIVDASHKLQRQALPWNKVIWDSRYAYINETTKEVQFLYLPLKNDYTHVDIRGFMETIIYQARPADEHDKDYISRFVYFLKSLQGYDPVKIEEYIGREDHSIVHTIKRHTTGGSGFMTDKPKDYYEHYNKTQENDGTKLLDDEATGILNCNDEATGLLASGDVQMGDLYGEETTLLQAGAVHYPTLYRVLTKEQININKPVFRMGKERSCVDYFITNNNAVSRSHADIITRGNRCFVMDLNSKNKTFINGQVIPSQQECEIYDGNQLMLGNEEFIFYA